MLCNRTVQRNYGDTEDKVKEDSASVLNEKCDQIKYCLFNLAF